MLNYELFDQWCRQRGAQAVWQAWRDGMLRQGREVSPERMSFESLSDRDKSLDLRIAFEVMGSLFSFLSAQPAVEAVSAERVEQQEADTILALDSMAKMYKSEFGEDARYQAVMDYLAYLEKRLTPRSVDMGTSLVEKAYDAIGPLVHPHD
jgi:hypothetical protein